MWSKIYVWTCQTVSMKTKSSENILWLEFSMPRGLNFVRRACNSQIISCQAPILPSSRGIHWRIVESAWWWLRQIPLQYLCICESRRLLTHFRRAMTLRNKMGIKCKFYHFFPTSAMCRRVENAYNGRTHVCKLVNLLNLVSTCLKFHTNCILQGHPVYCRIEIKPVHALKLIQVAEILRQMKNCRPRIASNLTGVDQEKMIASKKNRSDKKHITIYMMTIRHSNAQGRVQWFPNSSALLNPMYTTVLCSEDCNNILRRNGNEVEIWAVETSQIHTTN